MSDAFQFDDCVSTSILSSQSAANTAAATTPSASWLDLSVYIGDVAVVMNPGALTGSLTGKLQVGDDNTGANAVDVPGAVFAAAVAGTAQTISLNSDGTSKRYLGFVGTIVTGPAIVGVTVLGHKKYN